MIEANNPYKKLVDKAVVRKKELKAFLQKLRKKAPKNLDILVSNLDAEVFEEVDCLKCANCCKTTSPIFTDRDIVRIAKAFKEKPGQFIEQYLHLDSDNDYVLNVAPCPFLGADNYCGIYDIRPNACREYPHTQRKKFHQLSNITYNNTQMCPATAEIIMRLKDSLDKLN